MMATYIGVVGVLIAYLASTGVLGSRPEFETAMAWAEPFGSGAYRLVTKYWTAAERNTLNAPLEGVLLWNRVIWTAVGAVFLAAAYVLYRPSPRGAKPRKQERLKALVEKDVAVTPVGALPRPSYGFASGLTQLWSRAVLTARQAQLSEEAASAAQTGAELGRRMAQVGNWSRAKWQQEHAAWLDAQTAHDQARQQANAAREALVRELALTGTGAQIRLPDSLPPAPPLPARRRLLRARKRGCLYSQRDAQRPAHHGLRTPRLQSS